MLYSAGAGSPTAVAETFIALERLADSGAPLGVAIFAAQRECWPALEGGREVRPGGNALCEKLRFGSLSSFRYVSSGAAPPRPAPAQPRPRPGPAPGPVPAIGPAAASHRSCRRRAGQCDCRVKCGRCGCAVERARPCSRRALLLPPSQAGHHNAAACGVGCPHLRFSL